MTTAVRYVQTLSPTQSLTVQGHKLLRPSLCKEHAPRARSAELLSTFEPATCGPYVARNQVQIVELKKSRGEARGSAEKQGRTLRRTGVSRSAARRCAALLDRPHRECFASPVLSPWHRPTMVCRMGPSATVHLALELRRSSAQKMDQGVAYLRKSARPSEPARRFLGRLRSLVPASCTIA